MSRRLRDLRFRPRLPVSVLLLLDHQRAGAQVALALAGRHRGAHPRELCARRPSLPLHRRQFCSQQGLGARPRPHDQAARGGGERSSSSFRPTRSATRPRASSRRCARAGCNWVYIGLENINPENLIAAKKRQNKIWEYRKMLQKWKQARRDGLCRLHHRLPARHAGIDPARRGDHQARAPRRADRILLSDAAAGLGGSQAH